MRPHRHQQIDGMIEIHPIGHPVWKMRVAGGNRKNLHEMNNAIIRTCLGNSGKRHHREGEEIEI